MRIARDLGDVSQLLPAGVDGLPDCPFTLHSAILHALRILGYEELPSDERPPRHIWLDGEKLNEHFARMDRKRRKKWNLPDEDEDGGDGGAAFEENAAATELITRG